MDLHLLHSVWPDWEPQGEIGRGSFGVVYRAVRSLGNSIQTSAIKIIPIPQDSSELDILRAEGFGEDAIRAYLSELAKEFEQEFLLMESFSDAPNIVRIEDFQIVERDSEPGWDLFLRMELLTPLYSYLSEQSLDENGIIKLGIDLCSALECCSERDVIHRDIKPDNIFVDADGTFKREFLKI